MVYSSQNIRERDIKMKILLAEDEVDLNNLITKYLKKNGYSVESVFNGEEALDYLEYDEYDLIILDIMMPKINGFEVIKKLRSKGNHTPILLLTARNSSEDKVKGLDLGADDYIVKPFDFNELTARIRTIVRRRYGNSSNELSIGDLVLDTSKKTVTRAGKTIELTGKEYSILEYLMQSKNRILSREQIKTHVWDYNYEGDSNIIDVLIKNIRKKIHVEDGKQIIYTKRGIGYVVKDED